MGVGQFSGDGSLFGAAASATNGNYTLVSVLPFGTNPHAKAVSLPRLLIYFQVQKARSRST
jgi:hypothetical protein